MRVFLCMCVSEHDGINMLRYQTVIVYLAVIQTECRENMLKEIANIGTGLYLES